jgi:hypothetical protein
MLCEVTAGGCAWSPGSILRPCLSNPLLMHNENAVVDPTKADFVCIGYLERTFRIDEEVARLRQVK